MKNIFIQTSNEQLKQLIEKWQKNNNDVSEEIVKLLLIALNTTPIDELSL